MFYVLIIAGAIGTAVTFHLANVAAERAGFTVKAKDEPPEYQAELAELAQLRQSR
jgi:hypothetical protein